ncbi:DNA topoisomerase 2-binding protein 1-A-like [Bombus fervidus]|uniref:DNA topoisomerase 2-binding protein 1-A-like n=1 Tax=Bombus fervidus TaxID=203811 RepID=UPI003AB2FAF5
MNHQSKSKKRSNIYFIASNKKSEGYCSIDMLRAYNNCLEYGIKPKWVKEIDIDTMKLTKFDTLVVEKSEKIEMNKLVAGECCILEPEHLSFIINTNATCKRVMQNLCICTSHLCLEDKRYVQALVVKMSGNFTTELDDKVTHLVTSSVLSVEYEKASHMQIQIVTKEWVKAIWEANMIDDVKPDDKRFDKYKVPMFYNLVVTTTNIQRCQKEKIQHFIETNGGMYIDSLDCEKVNIILVPEDCHTSQKLKCARERDIICLTLNWLYESIKAGHALPSRNYIFQAIRECSPAKESNVCETPSYSTTSSITYDKQQGNYMDEATFNTSTMSNVSTFSTVTTVLDRPAFNEAELAGPFLYGCIIYLAGFASDQRNKLSKILNVGSAMQLEYTCDILTHVIVGDEDSAASELKLLKLGPLCPHILRLEWLEESIRLKSPAPEKNFLYEPSSSLIMNLELLQEKMSKEGEKSSNFGQEEPQNTIVSTTDEGPYIPTLNQMLENIEENLIPPEENNSDIINNKLFEGLTFVVLGFNDMFNYVAENIIAMNGRIVPGTFVNIPDYAIVPKYGIPLKCIVKEIVTDLFIVDCINQNRIVEIMYYHRPISVTKHILSSCVLTISTYTGVERSYLIALAVELGAICQDIFTREDVFDKDLYKNTHLICPIPEGKKYDAAVKWNVPVVTADWLVACAVESTWVNETPFLVVKNLGPERRMGLNVSLLESNTNQIVFSTEPVPSSSKSHNVIVPEEYFPNLEVQNNNSGNILLLNNEFSLPYTETTSELSGTHSQAFGPIPSVETERSQLEGISYPLNLKKEPPLEEPFSEILPATAKDGFN